jgi:hypothetical protein
MKFSMLHLPGKVNLKEQPESEWRGEGDKFSVLDSVENSVYEAELEMVGEDAATNEEDDEDEDMED